jgi:hypothetical protein
MTSLDLGPLLKRLRKVPRDAARIIEIAIDTDAKGFVTNIVKITPPSQGQANNQSKKRGEAKVATDIRKAYGTPSDLWRLIRDKAGRPTADNFWAYMKLQRWQQANEIALRITGHGLDVFDGGTEHQRRRSPTTGRVTGSDKPQNKRVFIADTQKPQLNRYITRRQAKVGLLASGFQPAASRLKASLPAWIRRHSLLPGTIAIHRAPGTYSITISNTSPYAKGTDLSRRMRHVLQTDKRKKRLAHRVNAEIRVALRNNQFATA